MRLRIIRIRAIIRMLGQGGRIVHVQDAGCWMLDALHCKARDGRELSEWAELKLGSGKENDKLENCYTFGRNY
jgi:uncharacterized protein YjhX (UPF0386 family)